MVYESIQMHQVVVLSEDIRMSFVVDDTRMISPVALRRAHDIALALPRSGGRVAHGIAQRLGTTGRGIAQIIMAIALVEPRSFLVMFYMIRKTHDAVFQGNHVVIQSRIVRIRVAPVHIRLSVVIGKHAGVDVIPVGLIPYYRFLQRIAERSVGRVGSEHTDAMTVQRCIEIILAIALNGLNRPCPVLTATPREVFQGSHSPVLCPVHHVGGRPQQPVIHKKAS